MQESNNKPGRNRKIYVGAIFILLLVVLPALSYVYLHNGLSFRKKTLAELRDFGSVRPEYVLWPDGTREDQLDGKVCVIHYFGEKPELTPKNQAAIDLCEELFNHFNAGNATDNLRFVMVFSEPTADFRSHYQTRPSAEYVSWVKSGALGAWRTILQNGYEMFLRSEEVSAGDNIVALSDTAGVVRRFYDINRPKEVALLKNHIGFLLPK